MKLSSLFDGAVTPVARRFEAEGDATTSVANETARERLLVAASVDTGVPARAKEHVGGGESKAMVRRWLFMIEDEWLREGGTLQFENDATSLGGNAAV